MDTEYTTRYRVEDFTIKNVATTAVIRMNRDKIDIKIEYMHTKYFTI